MSENESIKIIPNADRIAFASAVVMILLVFGSLYVVVFSEGLTYTSAPFLSMAIAGILYCLAINYSCWQNPSFSADWISIRTLTGIRTIRFSEIQGCSFLPPIHRFEIRTNETTVHFSFPFVTRPSVLFHRFMNRKIRAETSNAYRFSYSRYFRALLPGLIIALSPVLYLAISRKQSEILFILGVIVLMSGVRWAQALSAIDISPTGITVRRRSRVMSTSIPFAQITSVQLHYSKKPIGLHLDVQYNGKALVLSEFGIEPNLCSLYRRLQGAISTG